MNFKQIICIDNKIIQVKETAHFTHCAVLLLFGIYSTFENWSFPTPHSGISGRTNSTQESVCHKRIFALIES